MLLRLGVERIDLFYTHRLESEVPVDESVEIAAAGKVREPIEVGVMHWCDANDVAMVPYSHSPLGRGFLTGRYQSVDDFPDGDLRHRHTRFHPDAIKANIGLAERVREIADRLGVRRGQVALSWLLAQSDQVIPIPGTKRSSYLEENVGAGDGRLEDQALADLEKLPTATGIWGSETFSGKIGGPSSTPSS